MSRVETAASAGAAVPVETKVPAVVVDASAAVAYLLGEATGREYDGMRANASAPAFLDVEVQQVLRGLVRREVIATERAETALAELADLPVRRYPDAALLDRCWELRDRCSTYDGLYVALAEGLGATLLTRDGRLARSVADLVGIWSPEEPSVPGS